MWGCKKIGKIGKETSLGQRVRGYGRLTDYSLESKYDEVDPP